MLFLVGLGGLVGSVAVWLATGAVSIPPLIGFAGLIALGTMSGGVSVAKNAEPAEPVDAGLEAIHRAYERDEIDEDELERRIAFYLGLVEDAPDVPPASVPSAPRPRLVCFDCRAEVLTVSGHAPTDADGCPKCGCSVLVRTGA